MKETSKAMQRRLNDAEVDWKGIFAGRGVDVGSGDDPLPGALPFDVSDGDANHLSKYFESDSLHYVHASQVLEHMHDPASAVKDWLSVIKPGGCLVATVPDWVAYEGCIWPSRYNHDHKSTWSMLYKGSPAPVHIHIPSFLTKFKRNTRVVKAEFVDTNYDYKLGNSVDQTYDYSKGVECFNEFVLQKHYRA